MGGQDDVPHSEPRRSTTLRPSSHGGTSLGDAVGAVLAADIDGGATLVTATALQANSSVRARSRSPHPYGSSEHAAAAKSLDHSQSPDSRTSYESFKSPHDQHVQYIPSMRRLLDHRSETSSLADLDDLENEVTPPRNWKSRFLKVLEASKGMLMVILAMFFGACMGAVARIMQSGPDAMDAFQILFARMSITTALSLAYMKWQKVPDAPLGPPSVRKLLIARGMGGFFGVYGYYYSVKYLPLGEATVITFLAPMATNGICSVLLREPFPRREQFAGLISLVGVVLIAQPSAIFDHSASSEAAAANMGNSSSINTLMSNMSTVAATVVGNNSTLNSADTVAPVLADGLVGVAPAAIEATAVQRLLAVIWALLGVCGAACAYTTIRWIGQRAHPLISVNYFSCWCTVVSTVALSPVGPAGVSFRLPSGTREWVLLLSLGSCGMIMQFLLTAGLARQRGTAATNMTYTSVLWVLALDYVLWGTLPTAISALGCGLILGSQIWAAVSRSNTGSHENQGRGQSNELVRHSRSMAMEERQRPEYEDEESLSGEEQGMDQSQEQEHDQHAGETRQTRQIRRPDAMDSDGTSFGRGSGSGNGPADEEQGLPSSSFPPHLHHPLPGSPTRSSRT